MGVVNEEPVGEAAAVGNLFGETDGSAIGGISGATRFADGQTASSGANCFQGWLSEVLVFDCATNASDYLRMHCGSGLASNGKEGGEGSTGKVSTATAPSKYDDTPDGSMNMPSSGVSLYMANFIYYNHDDDNGNETGDVAEVSVSGENDLVMMTVRIGLLTNDYPGVWTLAAISGANRIRVWDNPDKSGSEVSLPTNWPITAPNDPWSGSYDTSYTYWVEGVVTSAAPYDVKIRTRYDSLVGQRFSQVTVSNTVFDFTLEPLWGTKYPPAKNPCGVSVGNIANPIVFVSPDYQSLPADFVRWTNAVVPGYNGSVDFPYGITGIGPAIEGCSTGKVRLCANIRGFAGPAPTMDMEVFPSNTTVGVHVYILCSTSGTSAISSDSVADAVDKADEVFEQVGVDIALACSVTYVTNDCWYDMTAETNVTDMCNYATNTGGLEIYFVHTSYEASIAGENSPEGLSVTTKGWASADIEQTLCHEIGHAHNLRDIYWHYEEGGTSYDLKDADEPVKEAWAPLDWNSGPGPLYYPTNLVQSNLINRLLMDGYNTWNKAIDIPRGPIWGMDNTCDTNGCYVEVGMFSDTNAVEYQLNRTPHHE